VFCVGQDLSETKTFDPDRAEEWIKEWDRLYTTVRGLSKPLLSHCVMNAPSVPRVPSGTPIQSGHDSASSGRSTARPAPRRSSGELPKPAQGGAGRRVHRSDRAGWAAAGDAHRHVVDFGRQEIADQLHGLRPVEEDPEGGRFSSQSERTP